MIQGHILNLSISGGSVDFLQAWHNPTITLSGGSVNIIRVGGNGIVYLVGTDFKVDGKTLSYGDKVGDFISLTGDGGDPFYFGTITGTLSDGSVLDCDFKIYNTGFNAGIADIVIIPEPATLFLLSLGGVLMRRKCWDLSFCWLRLLFCPDCIRTARLRRKTLSECS